MKLGTRYAVPDSVNTATSATAALLRLCLAKLGCAPAEFATRHLFVSTSVLNRLLNGQPPSPALEVTIRDVARKLGIGGSAAQTAT